MTKILSLKQIYQQAQNAVPLPENKRSEALSFEQASGVARRFAAEDVAVFMGIRGMYPSGSLPIGRVRACFNVYARAREQDVTMELAPNTWLALGRDEQSGQSKAELFVKYIAMALKCRRILQDAPDPADTDILDLLSDISIELEEKGVKKLGLPPSEMTLVKNLILPINFADMRLETDVLLMNAYQKEFDEGLRSQLGYQQDQPLEHMSREDLNIKFSRKKM